MSQQRRVSTKWVDQQSQFWLLLGCVGLFLVAVFAYAAPRAKGENVHRADANCRTCHTADRAALSSNPARARTLLVTNLEPTCNRCHGDHGPSHKSASTAQ